MKIVTASGKQKIVMTRKEWKAIGKKAGWDATSIPTDEEIQADWNKKRQEAGLPTKNDNKQQSNPGSASQPGSPSASKANGAAPGVSKQYTTQQMIDWASKGSKALQKAVAKITSGGDSREVAQLNKAISGDAEARKWLNERVQHMASSFARGQENMATPPVDKRVNQDVQSPSWKRHMDNMATPPVDKRRPT